MTQTIFYKKSFLNPLASYPPPAERKQKTTMSYATGQSFSQITRALDIDITSTDEQVRQALDAFLKQRQQELAEEAKRRKEEAARDKKQAEDRNFVRRTLPERVFMNVSFTYTVDGVTETTAPFVAKGADIATFVLDGRLPGGLARGRARGRIVEMVSHGHHTVNPDRSGIALTLELVFFQNWIRQKNPTNPHEPEQPPQVVADVPRHFTAVLTRYFHQPDAKLPEDAPHLNIALSPSTAANSYFIGPYDWAGTFQYLIGRKKRQANAEAAPAPEDEDDHDHEEQQPAGVGEPAGKRQKK